MTSERKLEAEMRHRPQMLDFEDASVWAGARRSQMAPSFDYKGQAWTGLDDSVEGLEFEQSTQRRIDPQGLDDSVEGLEFEQPTQRRIGPQGVETTKNWWPPSEVEPLERGKAIRIFAILISVYLGYVVYVALETWDSLSNPPVKVTQKMEPFGLPDVAFCPSAGDGCDSWQAEDCADMDWDLANLQGFVEDYQYTGTTFSPSIAPTWAPISPFLLHTTASPVVEEPPGPETLPTSAASPSPTAVPEIRFSIDVTGHEWCLRVPLSNFTIDQEGIDQGTIRSLHATVYVNWKDKISDTPLRSTRNVIGTFFLSSGEDIEDTTVDVRLPYSDVVIEGREPFTILSNDVVLTLSQYVKLDGTTKNTYSQATTTGFQTLSIDKFSGTFEGAFLIATFNVNTFAFQAIEELNPVDEWAIIGALSSVWGLVGVIFGLFFVDPPSTPAKRWRWRSKKRASVLHNTPKGMATTSSQRP